VASDQTMLPVSTLTPLLRTIARLVAKGATLGPVELRVLMLGADVEAHADHAFRELERWRTMLATLLANPSIDLINATSEAMLLRGLSEGDIGQAISTVVGYDITAHMERVERARDARHNGAGQTSGVEDIFTHLNGHSSERMPHEALLAALEQDDDEAILAAWHPSLEHDDRITREQRMRVEFAQERMAALERWRAATATGDERQIVVAWDPILEGDARIQPGERTLLRLAQWAVALPDHVRAVLARGLIPEDAGAPEGLQRVAGADVAVASARTALTLALDQGDAVAALEIERVSGIVLDDPRLTEVKRAALAENEPTNLDARLAGTALWAQWRWPPSPAIDAVAVSWRNDCFPGSPFELGTHSRVMLRPDYEQAGAFHETVGHQEALYVRLFSALRRDPTREHPDNWLVSPGAGEGATAIARHPCVVLCRLAKKQGSRKNALEITTEGGQPLPDLIVVRRTGGLPLKVSEGDIIAEVNAVTAAKPFRAVVQLDTATWPPGTVVRVFPADAADAGWVSIEGVRLDVT
jgi:hypothetical protein